MGKAIMMKTPAEYSKALAAARELAARTGQPDPFRPGGVIPLDLDKVRRLYGIALTLTPGERHKTADRAKKEAFQKALNDAPRWLDFQAHCIERDLLERRTSPLKRGRA